MAARAGDPDDDWTLPSSLAVEIAGGTRRIAAPWRFVSDTVTNRRPVAMWQEPRDRHARLLGSTRFNVHVGATARRSGTNAAGGRSRG